MTYIDRNALWAQGIWLTADDQQIPVTALSDARLIKIIGHLGRWSRCKLVSRHNRDVFNASISIHPSISEAALNTLDTALGYMEQDAPSIYEMAEYAEAHPVWKLLYRECESRGIKATELLWKAVME